MSCPGLKQFPAKEDRYVGLVNRVVDYEFGLQHRQREGGGHVADIDGRDTRFGEQPVVLVAIEEERRLIDPVVIDVGIPLVRATESCVAGQDQRIWISLLEIGPVDDGGGDERQFMPGH